MSKKVSFYLMICLCALGIKAKAIDGPGFVCTGSTATLTTTLTGGTWSASNGNATVASDGVVTGVNAGTVRISYIGSTTETKVLSVNASPTAITGIDNVCVAATGGISSTFPATAIPAWISGNTSVATINSSGIVTGVTAGTVVMTYSLNNGCYITKVITVKPLPAAITGPSTVCVGSTVTFSNSDAGGTWTSTASPARATIGASSGIATGNATGATTITYTLPNACRTTAILTVNAQPNGISGIATICVGSSVTYSSATSGGTWSSSNTAVATVNSTTGLGTGTGTGTATITYTVSGCSTTKNVTVNAAIGTISSPTLCLGNSSTLTTTAAPGGTWSSSNGSVATINSLGTLSTIGTGTSTITYSISPGCYTTYPVTVNPKPTVFPETPNVCPGVSKQLTSTPAGGTWSSSNTAKATIGATNGIVNGITEGGLYITYTLPTGCYQAVAFNVHPEPSYIRVGTTVVSSIEICVGGVSAVNPYPYPGDHDGWISSNPAIFTASIDDDENGDLHGISAGVATLTFTASDARGRCIRTAEVTVTQTEITGTTSICTGSTTTLSNVITGGTWSSSNTSVATVSAGGVVTGIAAGTAIITYRLGTGCYSTAIITVIAAPSTAGTITGAGTVCVFAQTTLANATPGGSWSSSNTGIATVGAATGIVSGVAAGSVTISYTVTNMCGSITTTKELISEECCYVHQLKINTGYDPLTDMAITPGDNGSAIVEDSKWRVTARSASFDTMTAVTLVTIGDPAAVITPASTWDSYVASGYISCLNRNNPWSDNHGTAYNMKLSRSFTTTGSGNVVVAMSIANDNYISAIDIDGGTSFFTQTASDATGNYTAFSTAGTTVNLTAGVHTINVYAHNYNTGSIHKNAMGVNIHGALAIESGDNSFIKENSSECGLAERRSNRVASPITHSLSLFPNPNNGTFVLSGMLSGADNITEAMISVIDMTGKTVYSAITAVSNGALNQQINLGQKLVNGIYMARVTTGAQSQVIRFTVNK